MKQKLFIPLLFLALYFGGRAWYFSPNATANELAPDFTATRADGQTFSLSDLRGTPVLLDFWGSWCGPCRRESPVLVDLHERVGGELTIVSVAIERDSAAWVRARTQDSRFWDYQVMEQTTSLKFLNGPIADLYGINSVPSNVLVGADGVVLGVNVDLLELFD
ncbi:TlpA family protein disulfide reductase [Neolewinella antarctica]|uniref:Thiol-disulfide isomerase/thioredoxin n=1 Tax=Neolewinella antarctica TaxID=442734 RepID=A0ABX0X9C2_9BACT|nr:TlpA disulfide reductase family protein [Neolewinella antarctica]NJC25860.1 thiol-disulfide isomerase/thioredoxin [Neolewinella antarctica]